MPRHFVILHHRTADGEHWDLMLEHGGVLLTWQLACEPLGPDDPPIAARRIGDHRLAYLDYEGPISGNRGDVRRIDRGTLALESNDAERLVMMLKGARLRGRYVLEQHGDMWRLVRGDSKC